MGTGNSHPGIPPWVTNLGERTRAWAPLRGKRLLRQELTCWPRGCPRGGHLGLGPL